MLPPQAGCPLRSAWPRDLTFQGNKVIRVKETYAGLGTEAPELPVPR